MIRAGCLDRTRTAMQDPDKQHRQKVGARREQPAREAAAPPPSSASASPHELGSESQGAGRCGRGSERQRVQHPGSLSPSVSWACPMGAPTTKLVSTMGEAPKLPRKKPASLWGTGTLAPASQRIWGWGRTLLLFLLFLLPFALKSTQSCATWEGEGWI